MTDDEDIVAFLTDRINRARVAIEAEDFEDAAEALEVMCDHGTYWCRECDTCNSDPLWRLIANAYKQSKDERS